MGVGAECRQSRLATAIVLGAQLLTKSLAALAGCTGWLAVGVVGVVGAVGVVRAIPGCHLLGGMRHTHLPAAAPASGARGEAWGNPHDR